MAAEGWCSVVMPLFDKRETVARAVGSVLGQQRADLELIVVDDGSVDDGAQLVRSCADGRVRLLAQRRAGAAAARNRGVALARAELVAFCDADDEWAPDHLEALFRLAARFPHAGVFATGYRVACAGETPRQNLLRGLASGFEEGLIPDYFALAAASEPPLHTSAVAVRRSALLAVGGFPEGVDSGEDLLAWARLAERFPVAYCRRPSATFWQPRGPRERPGRLPPERDEVGAELARMLERASGPAAASLAAYLALWHRMRGVVLLRRDAARGARREFGRALARGGFSAGLGALWLATLAPGSRRLYEGVAALRRRARGARR